MPRVMITGAGGQVGGALRRAAWPESVELAPVDRTALDIGDWRAVRRVADDCAPAIIINAAAFTDVDRAEAEPDRAYDVNDRAVGHLVDAADRHRAVLVQLSTDYVFDGEKDGWYVEVDPPAPRSIYGASKLAGELRALAGRRALVVRTSWVYGAHGPNFVRAIRRRARRERQFGVVTDQRGCPTAATDLAAAIVAIVAANCHDLGVFHVAAPDDASRWELAGRIVELMAVPRPPAILPIDSSECPARAIRPHNSRLDSSRLAGSYGLALPSWRDSLVRVSAELDGTGS